MKEVLQTIIEGLVDDKQSIEITEKEENNNIQIQVKVSEKDMGKIIGKQGKNANAIRVLIKALAGRQNKKVTIEFVS